MKTITFKVLSLLFVLSAHSNATTIMYKNFHELIDESQYVLEGTVKSIVAKRHADGRIYTTVEFHDAQVLDSSGKNDLSQPALIRYIGGKEPVYDEEGIYSGYEETYVPGTPELEINERYVMFINKNGESIMPFLGWGQGIFTITNGNVSDLSLYPVVDLLDSNLVLLNSKSENLANKISHSKITESKNHSSAPTSKKVSTRSTDLNSKSPDLKNAMTLTELIDSPISKRNRMHRVKDTKKRVSHKEFSNWISSRINKQEKATRINNMHDYSSLIDLPKIKGPQSK